MRWLIVCVLSCFVVFGSNCRCESTGPSTESTIEKKHSNEVLPDEITWAEEVPRVERIDASEPFEARAEEEPLPERIPEQSVERIPEQGHIANLDDFCKAFAKARCASAYACCQKVKRPYPDEATCVQKQTSSCVQRLFAEKQALEKGLLVLDAKNVEACLKGVRDSKTTCSAPPISSEHQCAGIVLDKASLGDGCKANVVDVHCAGGAGQCRANGPKGIQCLAWKKIGEDCSESACQFGLLCLLDPTKSESKRHCRAIRKKGEYCQKRTDCTKGLSCSTSSKCEPNLALGATCQRAGTCEDTLACHIGMKKCVKRVPRDALCTAHAECIEGTRCFGLRLVGVCQKPGANGAACENHKQCADGLGCKIPENRCRPLAKKGDACRSANDCLKDLGCSGGSCEPLPGEGKACLFGVRQCAAGLTCYSPKKGQGICQKPAKLGKPCSSDANCDTGLGCAADKCVKLPTAGGKCHSNYLCFQSYCDFTSRTCKGFHKVGDACKGGHECGPQGACIQKKDGSLVCVKTPKEGEACLLNCVSGLFCKQSLAKGNCYPDICAANYLK